MQELCRDNWLLFYEPAQTNKTKTFIYMYVTDFPGKISLKYVIIIRGKLFSISQHFHEYSDLQLHEHTHLSRVEFRSGIGNLGSRGSK